MKSTYRVLAGLVVVALAAIGFTHSVAPNEVAAAEPKPGALLTTLPADTAIAAVIEANSGKVPATGEQLWKALGKLGKFHQLPVPFSAVRLTSGLSSPRVVLAPEHGGVSRADLTEPNLDGRLFLAANMERPAAGGDPRVTVVEFISWNATRRRFDFGLIENMGGEGEPQVRVVDAGKCFVCHKNRGPILGVRPWSNTAHDDILRFATASGFAMSGSHLPETGPFALPKVVPGRPVLRDRIDGMALATSEAAEVDAAVRSGATLRTNRDALRLMTRTPDGRKAFAALLVAITEPDALDADDKAVKHTVDATFNQTFPKFAAELMNLQKAAKPSGLLDVDPANLLISSGVRPVPRTSVPVAVPVVTVPGLTGGSGSRWAAPGTAVPRLTSQKIVDPVAMTAAIQAAKTQKAISDYSATLVELARYEVARANGRHGLTTRVQPSNPKSFAYPILNAPRRPSEVVNPVILATTIGLTDGDRRFLTQSLAAAAKTVGKPKVTPAAIAKEVFDGPQFADVMAGGPLPDRDEFKDRFVAGLDGVLKAVYMQQVGFAPERRGYASGPRYDPNVLEEKEIAVVPTSACLRCHEVNANGKAPKFDPIPPLVFDPFDKPGREAWLKTVVFDPKRKQVVLARMLERLVTDADMPPEDAPEHDLFRVKDAAGFAEVKHFLATELGPAKKK